MPYLLKGEAGVVASRAFDFNLDPSPRKSSASSLAIVVRSRRFVAFVILLPLKGEPGCVFGTLLMNRPSLF